MGFLNSRLELYMEYNVLHYSLNFRVNSGINLIRMRQWDNIIYLKLNGEHYHVTNINKDSFHSGGQPIPCHLNNMCWEIWVEVGNRKRI